MDFMYEVKNARATRTNQIRKSSSKRNNNPVKRNNINPAKSKGVTYTIVLDSRKRNIIAPKFKSHFYEKPEVTYIWTQKDKEEVIEAIGVALSHLERALTEENVKKNNVIKDAIEKVIKRLRSRDLEIYPLKGNWLGQAQKGPNQISLNVELSHKSDDYLYSLAKTLIHEEFHIIGGCVEGQSKDSVCSDKLSRDRAFNKIASKNNIESMEADYFAQFVMQC